MTQKFTKDELKIFRKLTSPVKIQDFLNSFPMNFEKNGETCMSPRRVLQEKRAHCMEGAMLAAAALRLIGFPPLVLDLTSTKHDLDHVVTPFRIDGYWGAISKTNHGVLRYREPVYKTIRELAMSYFHEYFLQDGTKTLRSYSLPINLSRFDARNWMTSMEDLWFVPKALEHARHFPVLSRFQITGLRKADRIERSMGELVDWKK